MTDTIEDIRNIKWIGNHSSDMSNFDRVTKFIVECTNCEEQMEAISISKKVGMGIEGVVTIEDIRNIMSDNENSKKMRGNFDKEGTECYYSEKIK